MERMLDWRKILKSYEITLFEDTGNASKLVPC